MLQISVWIGNKKKITLRIWQRVQTRRAYMHTKEVCSRREPRLVSGKIKEIDRNLSTARERDKMKDCNRLG